MIANTFRDTCRRHATIRRNTPANGTGGTRTAPLRPPPCNTGRGRRIGPSGRRSFRARWPSSVENATQSADARPSELGRSPGPTSPPEAHGTRLARTLGLRDRTGASDQQARGATQATAVHRTVDARRRSRPDSRSTRAVGRGASRRKGASGCSRALARASARGTRRHRRAVRRRSARGPRTTFGTRHAGTGRARACRATALVSRVVSRAQCVAHDPRAMMLPSRARRTAAGRRR